MSRQGCCDDRGARMVEGEHSHVARARQRLRGLVHVKRGGRVGRTPFGHCFV